MTFGKDSIESSWKWGEQDLPMVSKNIYLGIDLLKAVHGACILKSTG